MSITDELREWWLHKFPVMDKELHKDFTAIADRIDAEHESACAEAYGNGVMSVPIALDESAWVKLPVDADGVPWHIGDRTESGQTIQAMGLNKHGWHFVGTVNEIDPSIHRHYHAPTVEDVLREFADGIKDQNADFTELAIAEYAKRLKLAEVDA